MTSIGIHELIEALGRPGAYPRPTSRVEVLQTHISVLFFAGDHVYKVKKPVRLPFLDFSDLEQRRRFCEEEVRLNRRLAPWMYRGVVPIVRDDQGGLRVDSRGEPVEWAVEMDRLPADRMLDRMLERGVVDNQAMDALVELLVGFHGSAATGPGVDEFGSPEAIERNVRENFEEVRAFRGRADEGAPSGVRTLSPELHAFLAERAEGFLSANHDLFERRVRDGRVREGHGDLHAGNVCFAPEGLAVYDCIEFAPRFRCGDVAADLAFLAMDLDHRGFAGFSGYLAHRYAERTGDEDLEHLLGFYKAYRAVVRGKVSSLTALDESVPAERRAELAREAERYFHLAAAYDLPRALVLMCGLPGSGKSWLARRIARPLGAALVRSDVRRKILAGVPEKAHAAAEYGTGLYTDDAKRNTYESLLASSVESLEAGRSVVVDATFSRRDWRRRFMDASLRLGHPCFVVHVEADEERILHRLAERGRKGGGASDADAAVYERARLEFEAPDEVPDDRLSRAVSGVEAPEEVIGRLIDLIVASEG